MQNSDISASAQKARYGVDAPGVIRNLFLSGVGLFLIIIFFPVIRIGNVQILTPGLVWMASFLVIGGLLMLFYSLKGKFIHRDRMLGLHQWQGDEQVLDVGTGKGLLMIGAAKHLTTGKSIGIDIWNTEDLSGNNYENANNNAAVEGVADRVQILNENAMEMSFDDNNFDVIVTNQVIHNIYNKAGRQRACEEIARVLKPGGKAIISDWKHMNEYLEHFNGLGLRTKMLTANYLTTYPPLKILVVKK
ncbi:methyltransferase family protein [Mucilaginibacter yixingensis]|uniref:Methyltransferase family protein n=1 Tax=Mucilaginibacter yixingensis TaxID=1295612 RepID=A0A2T5JDY7_9SPHI|nr:class I SAM-dependent methyltransferase [Mucilaginibacter yixingensis]PTQ99986.1 methyltransferase family protein [Mucilaginibacter yixingensis]